MPLINTFDPSVAVNTGTDIITINAHGFINRQGVIYHSGGGTAVGGLVDGYKYYVIFVSNNTFKLALTEDKASNNIAVDLLTVGTGSIHTFETSNIYPNSAAYYDFFRKVRLLGNGASPTGNNLEADSVRDNLTIVAGSNIVFENISEEQDTFTISGAEYDFDVPVGTTELRLYGRVGPVLTDDQSIRFSVDRGINITRISDTELRFEGLGVTETDTLHTVTERGAITSNTVYLNNLEVGIIQSIPGEDGVTTVTSTGTTGIPINLTGDGTLDSPVEIDLPSSTEASKTVYVNFTTPVSGTLTYSASYKSESALTTGSVILQREDPLNPGTWVTIDSATGTTSRYAYTIQNVYAEPNTGPTNFRIITSWTGLTTGYVDFPINLQFEIDPIYINEMIRTDTAAGELYLGRLEGDVFIRGTVNVLDRISTDGLTIFQNNIQGTNSNDNIVIDPNGTGAVELRTQTLTTDQTTFNLLDTVATTVNAFGSATAINIGANTGTITIENPTVVGTVATQNLYDTTATTINAFGDATAINIGDTTGTITLRNPTLVGTETTQNVYNTVATTVNAFGAATTVNVGSAGSAGTLTIKNDNVVLDGDLQVKGGDLTTNQTTFNLLNTTATTVNFAGVATSIEIGAATGTTNVNNNLQVDLDLEVRGGDITTDQTTFNLLNTTATTINAFGAASTINLRNLVITSSNTIDSSDSSGITFIPLVIFNSDVIVENDLTVNRSQTIGNNLSVGNDLTVSGNLTVNGTTTTLNTTILDVEDLNITIAKGSLNAAAANGAGLTVDGASATLLYVSSTDSWNFNKSLRATSLDNTPIGTNTRAAGNFTTLDANATVSLSPVSSPVTISPTGTGTVAISPTGTLTINPGTLSSINNTTIGATTAATGRFTTLQTVDTVTTTRNLTLASTSSIALTGNRTLTIDVENASRTIALGGNIDLANNFTTSGNFALTLTTTNTTNVTLPTSGTLATTGNLSQFAATTSSQLAGVISDETGSGSLVFGTNPTLASPTFGNASSTTDADATVDASTTSFYAYVQSASGTARTINISNLTAGRVIHLYLRNTNAATKVVNITASTTTTGFAAVNLATSNGAASATSVTLAATSGTAMVTVFNANGVFGGGM